MTELKVAFRFKYLTKLESTLPSSLHNSFSPKLLAKHKAMLRQFQVTRQIISNVGRRQLETDVFSGARLGSLWLVWGKTKLSRWRISPTRRATSMMKHKTGF